MVDILPNGVIHAISGEYYPEIEVDPVPKVSVEEAFNIAKEHWDKYSLHTDTDEIIVNFIYTSKAKLTIRLTAQKTYLLWCIDIFDWDFYIDAHSGVIREAYFLAPGNGRLQPPRPQGDIQVSSGSLNFEIDSTGDYPTKEVVVNNTGESPLVIRDVVLQGGPFTIEEPSLALPLPVASGSEAVIYIGFSPSATGESTGILSIESTDKDNPVVEILLRGEDRSSNPVSQEKTSDYNYHYNLSPYSQSWFTPFSLLYTPANSSNINQDSLYSLGYPFTWNWQYFNQGKENPQSLYIYSPLYDFPNILSFSLPYYHDYYFPYYKLWE